MCLPMNFPVHSISVIIFSLFYFTVSSISFSPQIGGKQINFLVCYLELDIHTLTNFSVCVFTHANMCYMYVHVRVCACACLFTWILIQTINIPDNPFQSQTSHESLSSYPLNSKAE